MTTLTTSPPAMGTNHTRLAVVLASGENGLGTIRSLGEAGVPLVTIVASRWEPAFFSRYGRKVVVRKDETIVPALLDEFRRLPKGFVVIPTNDYYVTVLNSSEAFRGGDWVLALPSAQVLDKVFDKGKASEVMDASDVPGPKTISILPPNCEDVVTRLGLPIVLKPRTDVWKKTIKRKTITIYSLRELKGVYECYRAFLPGLVAQEYIPGEDNYLWECICVFDKNSELRSAFTFRKLSTSPPHFGVTALGVSERNATILEIVRHIGKSLRYTGPADFDFKLDPRDGKYKYLEVNPRLGMCNVLGCRAGVNLALDAYLEAAGAPGAPILPEQADGFYYLNLLDDFWGRRQTGQRLTAILRTYRKLPFGRRLVGSHFSWRDPLPGFFLSGLKVSGVVWAAVRKIARRATSVFSRSPASTQHPAPLIECPPHE